MIASALCMSGNRNLSVLPFRGQLGELGLTHRTEHFVAVKNDVCRASDVRGNVSGRPVNAGDRMETLGVKIAAM